MDSKARPSLAELKVGVFVLVTCAILGAAIFTIGTQVGFFEDTFYARTYLNNVSGLKPGDIVLLAGVEVGNVIDVQISTTEELPPTQSNQSLMRQIERFTLQAEQLQQEISINEENLRRTQEEYDQALQQYGEEARQTRTLEREVEDLEELVEDQRDDLDDLGQDIETARTNLQNIVVSTLIKSKYRDWIKRDSNISLGSIGLLGDKYIEISLGRGSEPPLVIQEEDEGWLGSTTHEVVMITGTSQPGFQELITGADDVLANLALLSDKVNAILEPLSEGEGTVGTFISDTSFYDNLNRAVTSASQTVDQATRLVRDFREGEGTLARLIQDREVYDKINDATGHLQHVLTQIDQGRGTLGKLVNDPSIYEKSDKIMENIERITRRIDEGQGTLGQLSTDDQLYENLRQSLDRFTTFVQDIQQGKGTLGRLANDEQLYQNLNQVSAEMIKLLYDFRQNPKEFLTIKLEIF